MRVYYKQKQGVGKQIPAQPQVGSQKGTFSVGGAKAERERLTVSEQPTKNLPQAGRKERVPWAKIQSAVYSSAVHAAALRNKTTEWFPKEPGRASVKACAAK